MSEEIENANINVPRSIFVSMLLNGVMGFAILLATMFSLGDINAALDSPTKYPFIEIFTQATGSAAGGTGMTIVITIMVFAATIGFTATSSRMIWAFARDKGLPFSSFLSKVSLIFNLALKLPQCHMLTRYRNRYTHAHQYHKML